MGAVYPICLESLNINYKHDSREGEELLRPDRISNALKKPRNGKILIVVTVLASIFIYLNYLFIYSLLTC